jgi:membrane protease YdiL (CAAX protease family)
MNLRRLIEKPSVSIILILLLNFLFLLTGIIINNHFNIEEPKSTLVMFICMSVLFFGIIPFLLRLPNRTQSLKDYLNQIRFTQTKPLVNLIILGIMCSIIIFLSSFGVALFSSWNLEKAWESIIPPTSWSLSYAIIPGIFEEVAFRGVIFTILMTKYKPNTAILISSVIFGLAHSVNVLMGQDVIITIAQLGFAFFLGLLLAIIVWKTNSLIPTILIHYLLDAVGPFFVYPLFELETDPFFILGAMIIGLGIIPLIGGLGIVRIFDKYLPETFQGNPSIGT